MSTLTTDVRRRPARESALADVRVTQLRVLRSEWTKFRSLRSTLITLAVAIVLTVGMGLLFAAVTNQQWDKFSPGEKATFDPIALSLGGFNFSQLALGVLGVLLITGEYSTGMIRASLTAVPRRLPVLWGKLAVFVAAVFPLALAASLAAFLGGQALLDGTGRAVDLGSPGAARSVVGAALYVTLAGLIAMGLGGLLRNTAAGISTFVGVFFVLPPLTQLLPESWSGFVPYPPSQAGTSMWGGSFGPPDPSQLSPGAGLAVLLAWTAASVAAAAWRLHRSDA
ncbi:MAG: type transport system permease protein [Frankiaceae bacterium]|jgi:ABC-type transport system involved in multi-copper enzyme maturation permease subunit|nr:type transport system permease protein [Frankiaceae bacterium]